MNDEPELDSGKESKDSTRLMNGPDTKFPASKSSDETVIETSYSGEPGVWVSDNSSARQKKSSVNTMESTKHLGFASVRDGDTGQQDAGLGMPTTSIGVGSVLKGRFVLEAEIARGGMGIVYKALDLRKSEYKDRDPYVAVKVLTEECKSHQDFFMALQRETRKSQKLAHPNIVTVFDFDSDGDIVFMTMELLEGQTLDTLIKQSRPDPIDRKIAFSIINGIGQGLAYAHQNGIVHSDFKPGNVFVTTDGNVKILDFGISQAAKTPGKISHDRTVFDVRKLGALTPSYASCEMLEDEDPDPRDDIYAFACVAYELLTGRHPFNRQKATLARNERMKPERIPGLSMLQWKGLLHGLSFNRKLRTATVNKFLQDLNGDRRFLGLSHGWQMMAGLAVIVLVAAAIQLPSVLSKNEEIIEVQPAPIELSREQRDMISRLLEAAEVHFMVGRITEPEGSSAYDAYRHVLDINPNDLQARAGLAEIANHYEKLARESWASGDRETALSQVNSGLKVDPAHPGLADLYQELVPRKGWLESIIGSVRQYF